MLCAGSGGVGQLQVKDTKGCWLQEERPETGLISPTGKWGPVSTSQGLAFPTQGALPKRPVCLAHKDPEGAFVAGCLGDAAGTEAGIWNSS